MGSGSTAQLKLYQRSVEFYLRLTHWTASTACSASAIGIDKVTASAKCGVSVGSLSPDTACRAGARTKHTHRGCLGTARSKYFKHAWGARRV